MNIILEGKCEVRKRAENTSYYYRSDKIYDFARKFNGLTTTGAQEKMPLTTSYFSLKSLSVNC